MKKSIFLGFMLLSAAPAFTSTNLDQQMSLQDKQLTGIVNLTLKQKQALGSWIDKHYVPMGQAPVQTAPEMTPQPTPPMPQAASQLSLNINLNNGQELVLSDMTRWQIHPQDVMLSSVWVAPSSLSVKPGTDPSYPFVITNLSSNQSVRAKQVVPATTPAAPAPSTTPIAPSK